MQVSKFKRYHVGWNRLDQSCGVHRLTYRTQLSRVEPKIVNLLNHLTLGEQIMEITLNGEINWYIIFLNEEIKKKHTHELVEKENETILRFDSLLLARTNSLSKLTNKHLWELILTRNSCFEHLNQCWVQIIAYYCLLICIHFCSVIHRIFLVI